MEHINVHKDITVLYTFKHNDQSYRGTGGRYVQLMKAGQTRGGTGRGFLGSGKGGKERGPGPYRLPIHVILRIGLNIVKKIIIILNNYRLPIGSYRLTLCTTEGPFMVDKRICVPRVTG
jgi:hypothetical protein